MSSRGLRWEAGQRVHLTVEGEHRLGPGRIQLEAQACGFDPSINMDGVRSVIAVRLAADTD